MQIAEMMPGGELYGDGVARIANRNGFAVWRFGAVPDTFSYGEGMRHAVVRLEDGSFGVVGLSGSELFVRDADSPDAQPVYTVPAKRRIVNLWPQEDRSVVLQIGEQPSYGPQGPPAPVVLLRVMASRDPRPSTNPSLPAVSEVNLPRPETAVMAAVAQGEVCIESLDLTLEQFEWHCTTRGTEASRHT